MKNQINTNDDMKNVNNETNNHPDGFALLKFRIINPYRRKVQSNILKDNEGDSDHDAFGKIAVLKVIEDHFKRDPKMFRAFLDLLFKMVEIKNTRLCEPAKNNKPAKINSNGVCNFRNDYAYWELIKSSRDNKEELKRILCEIHGVNEIIDLADYFDDYWAIERTLKLILCLAPDRILTDLVQILVEYWNRNIVFDEYYHELLCFFCEDVPETMFGAERLEELEDDDTYW